MSNPPSGYNTPKTNWQSADVVLPTDLNRIEGNINAIETGSRTIDPAQSPSGNSGSLRQWLDWFPNMIKKITGKTNWYDTPDTTLAAAKTHIDATAVHSATSAPTANRIILRDASGRAQVASPSAAADIATKGYVDSATLAAVKTHIDATTVHGATSSATANRIILRDANGRAKVASPSAAADIATKGYVDSIETGARTVDPAQVPSGNTGTLRQFLNWLPNRIKAITGKTNWYDAPPTTLTAAKSHIDAAAPHSGHETPTGAQAKVDAHANLTAAHSATSTATANRIIIRDSAGRAKVAAPSSASDIATKGYVDSLVGPLQAGTAFAYYLTPPDNELNSNNTDYDDWWVQDVTRSVVVRILLPGTIRYHVQYRASATTRTTYVRILQNGSQIREESTSSTSWQTVTGNITVSPGDIVTFQKRTSDTLFPAYWRNVRIETAQPTLGIQRF